MTKKSHHPNTARTVVFLLFLTACGTSEPTFEVVQPELFSAPGAQPNAWADYDNDGNVDLFVAFRYQPNHLFRNDDDAFTDVTERSGIGDPRRTVGVV